MLRLLLSFFLFVSFNAYAAPADDARLQALKTHYLKLRNTDIHVDERAEWSFLANDLEQFVNQHPKNGGAASALNNCSILYEKLYER